MQKAIESCIGMAAHIVAERGWKRSENTRSLFEILEKHEIISKELSKKMSGAVGFRNIVVHKYTDIDYNLAYSDLDEKMSDIKSFAKVVKSFISSG
ncbi:MAG: HepT-like ribonuclease domain-containing protein [Nanoarchaeota archaeon]|nr:HepT-like ribonuclease domain-containing protein [Nanoarchaeota archaeon]